MKPLAIISLIVLGCTQTKEHKITVAATTSMIGSMLREIGGDKVEVITVVPAGLCPGHFDVKPQDIIKVRNSNFLICHGFEGWVDKLIHSIDQKDLKKITIDVEGSWMVPEVNEHAAHKILHKLSQIQPEEQRYFEQNLKRYEQKIESFLAKLDLKVFKGTPVVASEHQSQFLRWLGFYVVETYGRPEEFNPTQLRKIINKAKRHKILLVVDNFQSGPAAGRQIAEEAKAKHIALSNFPLANSYLETLKKNILELKKALSG